MEILEAHLALLQSTQAAALQAVVLVGSLTNGSYTGDAGSDIDLIHVLRDDAPAGCRQAVLSLIARTEEATNKDLPISRCVYRFRDLFRPYPTDFPLCLENKDYIELPIEIMRMKDSGKTVWGEDIVRRVPYPRREDVIASKKLSGRWAREDAACGSRPIPVEALPVRLIVQSVLVRAMLDYYFSTGTSCSCKKEVAARLTRDVPDYAFAELTALCGKWRYQPEAISPADEAEILAQWPRWLALRKGHDVDYVPRNPALKQP